MLIKLNKFPIVFIVGILILAFTFGVSAKDLQKNVNNRVQKTTAGKYVRTLLNICNWGHWIDYNGQSAGSPNGQSGGFYPRSTAAAIYLDGIVCGGYVNDDKTQNPRVIGQHYRIGTTPGWIENGVAVPASNDRARMYRIRADWESYKGAGPGGQDMLQPFQRDAQEINLKSSLSAVTQAEMQAVLDQYETDWNEWPTDLGAPFYDLNDNEIYEPDLGETPGIADADQVVWFVVNDFTQGAAQSFQGCFPMKLEIQITLWGYNQPAAKLGQIIFKKFKVTNYNIAGPDSLGYIKDFYMAQWSDPDLGSAGDDVVGCDTTKSLGYVYNGYPTDSGYGLFGLTPPACGYDFFQGPMIEGVAGEDKNKNGVDDAMDYAIFDLDSVGPGYINLPMTSFFYFSAGDPVISDPPLGEYTGAVEWYNMLKGYTPTQDLVNPTPYHEGNSASLPATFFPMAGDPVTGTGDVDGSYGSNPSPADRRMGLCTGPIDLAPGETQELVIAVVGRYRKYLS